MDFAAILDKWENRHSDITQKNKSSTNKKIMQWIEKNGVVDKDSLTENSEQNKNHTSYKNIAIDSQIDLHGLSLEEAKNRLSDFIEKAYRQNLKKVLIIHGKGIHSSNTPVLSKMVNEFIKENKHCGASGHPKSKLGASGATWVIIK